MSGFSVSTQEKDLSKFALAIQQLYAGRSNAAGVVTLNASASSTTVSGQNISTSSKVFLFPATADAAAALATTYVPTATITKQQFIIQHANNAQADKTFFWVALG